MSGLVLHAMQEQALSQGITDVEMGGVAKLVAETEMDLSWSAV